MTINYIFFGFPLVIKACFYYKPNKESPLYQKFFFQLLSRKFSLIRSSGNVVEIVDKSYVDTLDARK